MIGIASFGITIGVYLLSKQVYKKWRYIWTSPMITSFLAMVILLSLSKVSYTDYTTGAKWLSRMLEPATVAFAIPLYKHFDVLKKYAFEVLTSLFIGTWAAILTSVLFGKWLHLSSPILQSLAPRSVTTPIAMDISRSVGGLPVMTAVFVVLTGIIGIIVGPLLIRAMNLHTPIAKGTLLGMGAHGIGTAKAFEFGNLEGTISSLSMIIAAGFTILLAPVLVPFLCR